MSGLNAYLKFNSFLSLSLSFIFSVSFSLSLKTGSERTRAGDVISRASDWLCPRRHATWEDVTFNPWLVLLINEPRLIVGLELYADLLFCSRLVNYQSKSTEHSRNELDVIERWCYIYFPANKFCSARICDVTFR